MHPKTLLAGAAVALIIAGCGGVEMMNTTTQAHATSTTAQPTTTAPLAPTTAGVEDAYALTRDVLYLSDDERELRLDVYVPLGDGPFPVVVLIHGLPSSKDDPYQSWTAAAAAEAGMAVFVPDWNPTPPSRPRTTDLREAFATTACALAYAEQEAESYGGDPTRVVTSGFSAGALEAAWLALGHDVGIPEGCVAGGIPYRPVGAVLGDSEYFLHSRYFDQAFDADPDGMQEITSAIVDPAHWPDDLSARFRIWYAESSPPIVIRRFEDAWAEDDWLAQRDPGGSIREDLSELGLLADGIISYLDESELLAFRLRRAGLDATATMHPGGHTMLDKTDELVAYLLDAAGTG